MIRKIGVCVLFVFLIITAFGCGTSNGDETTLYNPYFFSGDQISLTARAVYGTDPLVEETGRLKL